MISKHSMGIEHVHHTTLKANQIPHRTRHNPTHNQQPLRFNPHAQPTSYATRCIHHSTQATHNSMQPHIQLGTTPTQPLHTTAAHNPLPTTTLQRNTLPLTDKQIQPHRTGHNTSHTIHTQSHAQLQTLGVRQLEPQNTSKNKKKCLPDTRNALPVTSWSCQRHGVLEAQAMQDSGTPSGAC